jgi:hypothetical protein
MKLTEKLAKGLILPTVINAQTVRQETFYNLLRLQEQIRYTDPISAIEQLKLVVHVARDESGNVLTAKLVEPVRVQHT